MTAEQVRARALEAGFQRAGIDARDPDRPLLVCALSCHRNEPDDMSRPGDPHALVAPFARRDHYREAVQRLRSVRRCIADAAAADAASSAAWGLFANSRIPEKPAAVAAGIGLAGRNGLVIAPGLGSQFIIAGIALDIPLRGAAAPVRQDSCEEPCGPCTACIAACPVGAITAEGGPDPQRCLQWFASRAVPLPAGYPEAWGARLYGCQACQDACPHNRSLRAETPDVRGEIGPSVPIRRILAAGVDGVKAMFRGTALGMSWISPEALIRNALLAAGHRGDASVLPEAGRYGESGSPLLRTAAAWAAFRLQASVTAQ